MSKKIIILILVMMSLLVGCTKTVKKDSTVKSNETKKEIQVVQKEETKEKQENEEEEKQEKAEEIVTNKTTETKVLDAYKSYGGYMSYAGDYNLNEEDDNFIQALISRSLFINNDYNTIQDVIESFYGTYNYSVNKIKDGVYEVTYTMDFEFEGTIEKHKMIIRADFNASEYKLIELSIDNEVIKTAKEIDNFIYSLNDCASNQEETSILEEQPQQEQNTVNNKNKYMNDFRDGMFYGMIKAKFIYNRYMINRLRMSVYDADEYGNVYVKMSEGISSIYLTFTEYDGYWRVTEAKLKNAGKTTEFNPTYMESLIIEEMLG